ncbi:MAG TPA: ubiquinol oxidase subunit II [Rhizobiaceae bacterium]|nr:ubiquinol oxidase subunit II [Rhizobiaceae bacterium]
MLRKLLLGSLTLPAMLALSGCNMVVLHPSGYIATQQRDIIIISTILMLLIIVPVMILTALFAWKYRQGNRNAEYRPDWHHSTRLEVVIWSAPLAIIIALGAITWVSTHTLDPYRPLEKIDANQAVTAQHKPLTVEVVSMNWKWLFLYPEEGIATVNELAAPVNTPIYFKITSSDLMNSFYVPALAGQIYSMAGMETKLHAVINKPGIYDGFSANYSGAGFSNMNFKFHGMSDADFKAWVEKVKKGGDDLSVAAYEALAKPSQAVPVHYYKSVAANLYHDILNRCVGQNQTCMDKMMPTHHEHHMESAGVDGMSDMPGMAEHSSHMEPHMAKTAGSNSGAMAKD